MQDWKNFCVTADQTIFEAVDVINRGAEQFCVVLDKSNKLLGIVGDGDIRRAILKKMDFQAPVSKIMNTNPVVVEMNIGKEEILSIMKRQVIRQLPVVDQNKKLVGIEFLSDLLQKAQAKPNKVVIMAGGQGKRLYPLTQNVPKPLLEIGDKPILEIIISNFKDYGFTDILLSVNYRSDLIEDYFGNGEKFGVNISYIKESEPMGTAGSLSLINSLPKDPMIVMNGDIITKINFNHLLEFHKKRKSKATMCVREYDFEVPFGVIKEIENNIVSIDEKPIQKMLINAGVYVLDSDVLQHIPKDTVFNMTNLFETLISKGISTSAFPVVDYWMDIGRKTDLEQVKGDFSKKKLI